MRASVAILIFLASLSGCRGSRGGTPSPPRTPEPVTERPQTERPPVERPQIDDVDVDELLDFDQPREQKPGGSWTERRYVGPKQYDRLFVALVHDAKSTLPDPPRGPLGDIERIELLAGGTTVLASIPRTGFQYQAEYFSDFVDDVGEVEGTRERLKVFLGAAVGAYVASTHPFHLVLRGRTAAGVLVVEAAFRGDETSEYSAIVPPRPY